MKKILFLLLFVILGLLPKTSNAITQNQISSVVQIVCTDGKDNWFSGSGTIIDSKGIILTNRHVVEGAYKNTCFVGFLGDVKQEPDFGSKGNPNLAEVKYITKTDDMDAALLYLKNNNKSYPYVNIWASDSNLLKFGDKIEIVGFPGIGGSTITYTSGEFSGFGSTADRTKNYLKTTAAIEHGNSGGSAYNSSGQFVGIPTFVVSGELNSISYIFSVNIIKQWLLSILGSEYQSKIIKNQATPDTSIKIQDDIIPPNISTLDWLLETNIWDSMDKKEQYNFNNRFYDGSVYAEWPAAQDPSGIKGYYVYWGTNINANPSIDGKFQTHRSTSKTFSSYGNYYLIIQAQDNFGNISQKVVFTYSYGVLPEWITNDPVQYSTITNRPDYFYIYDYSNGTKGNLLTTVKFDSSKTQSVKVSSNNLLIEWDGVENKDFITKTTVYFDKGDPTDLCRKYSYFSATPDEQAFDECYYTYKNYGFKEAKNDSITKTRLDINSSYRFVMRQYSPVVADGTYLGQFGVFNLISTKSISLKTDSVIQKMGGKILLQVQSHGEAWYVNPKDGKRYYMANGDKAYSVMRKFGVGITNRNLEKIKSNKTFAKSNSGKIFLQVESRGEAYYVDFNGIAHYLKDGTAAYRVMKSLGLGITNNDLNKILEGSL